MKSNKKKKEKLNKKLKEQLKDFNILRYENYDTLKKSGADDQYYVETDSKFIEDVANIAKIRRNLVFSLLDIEKQNLTSEDLDEIDYKARIHRRANIVNTNTKKKF